MPDRIRQPDLQKIKSLNLPFREYFELSNGIPVTYLPSAGHEVVKLDIVFRAGRPYETKQLTSRTTNIILKEASRQYSSAEVAEHLDFYGCSLGAPYHIDASMLTLYSPSRQLSNVLPIVADLLAAPSFPEQELHTFINSNSQRLNVELSKNDTVAYRAITESIFGSQHPYGYNSSPEAYHQVRREDLLSHYRRCYNSNNAFIFLSGHLDDTTLKKLDTILSASILSGSKNQPNIPNVETKPQNLSIEKRDSIQTAIRIGRRLFNRHHQDYPSMYLLNMILGGYFGSRLMSNLREEQGYTYNVYSSLDTMCYDGGFYIATEVSNDKVEETLAEIYKEIEILQEELIPTEELEMVVNYTMGYLLTLIDGTFNASELIKSMQIEGLPADFFNTMVERIQHTTPNDIRELSQKHLSRDQLWQVIVGTV